MTFKNIFIQKNCITFVSKSGYYVNEIDHSESVQPERRWHNDSSLTYNFSRNGVNLSMNSEFKRAMRQTAKLITDENFRYPDYSGDYELRKQICHMLGSYYEIKCSPTQVVIGVGLNYLLDSLMRVIGSDKVYGFENPAYYKVIEPVRVGAYKTKYLNVKVQGITAEDLNGFDADAIFLMPYHHYPLSYIMTAQQKKAVIDLAGDNRYVIEYGLDMEYIHDKHLILFYHRFI